VWVQEIAGEVEIRAEFAPKQVSLVRKLLAAIRRATLALLFVGSRPFPMILSPLMRLSGHNRSQEMKGASSAHLLISQPASLKMVAAIITWMPSI
jgi:hypothetical protein